jgi:hypothetical protein
VLNNFYIGEVKYKSEFLPGEQPPIMNRALFEAVRQKALAQWSHRKPAVRGARTQSRIASAPGPKFRIRAVQKPELGFNCA